MLYILFASLSEPDRIMKHTGLLTAPLGFTLEGYTLAFRNPNILTGYMNTLIYVVVGTALSVVVTAAGAFVTSRKDALLARPIMLCIIFTMYFSGGLIPLYLLVNELGLFDTRAAIILVGAGEHLEFDCHADVISIHPGFSGGVCENRRRQPAGDFFEDLPASFQTHAGHHDALLWGRELEQLV